MSQKELIDAICQQAHVKTDHILAEAEEKASIIMKKAESELSTINKTIIDQARSSMKSEEAMIINEARLQAKKELLAAQHKLVEKAMKGLEEKLSELSNKKEYPELLKLLIDEALDGTKGRVTIKCRANDRKLVEEYVQKRGLDADIVESPFPLGGVEVTWGESSELILKNTFSSRMEKIYPELLKEANRLIMSA